MRFPSWTAKDAAAIRSPDLRLRGLARRNGREELSHEDAPEPLDFAITPPVGPAGDLRLSPWVRGLKQPVGRTATHEGSNSQHAHEAD